MKLAEFGRRTEAEQAVIAGLGTGRVTVLGDGSRPEKDAGEDRRVDASLIRWLALGAPGDEAVRLHEKGLRIMGALVVSDGQCEPVLGEQFTPGLDLEGCALAHDLMLVNCRFEHAPLLLGARVQSLFLNGSALKGLTADGLEARRSVALRGVRATGEVRFLGARIGGDLVCVGGRFENPFDEEKEKTRRGSTGRALTADGLEARGSVALRGVRATGEVRFLGARIDGDLVCDGGRFENAGGDSLTADGLEARGRVALDGIHATGEVRLVGARIGGNLECVGGRFENPFDEEKEKTRPGSTGKALSAQGARVTGALFWRPDEKGNKSRATGAIDLMAAEIGRINDDPACWPGPGDLLLDRCRYGAFTGKGISGAERIRWLDLQTPERWGKDFWPQPWEHCAKVLREMGHAEGARQVLIAKEARQRRANRVKVIRGPFESLPSEGLSGLLIGSILVTLVWLLMPVFLAHYLLLAARDWLLGALIAYGHRPLRALWWLAGLWLFGWGVFAAAHGDGGFKPNNAFILAEPEWAQCEIGGERRSDHPSTLACYRDQPEAKGYPAFNPLFYSLDTLVPVVDLEVQAYWVPDERAAPWARWYLWGHIGKRWFG